MTESETIEAFFLSIAVAESQFEFWMSVTIALVVAAHAAGDTLNSKVRVLMAALYLFSCALFYLRYDAAVQTLLLLHEDLRAMGSDIFGLENTIPMLRIIRSIVVIGASTLAVVIIVNPNFAKRGSDDT